MRSGARATVTARSGSKSLCPRLSLLSALLALGISQLFGRQMSLRRVVITPDRVLITPEAVRVQRIRPGRNLLFGNLANLRLQVRVGRDQ